MVYIIFFFYSAILQYHNTVMIVLAQKTSVPRPHIAI